MSADNGFYVLGPCSDGKFRVGYAAAIDNIDYPSRCHPNTIKSTQRIFGKSKTFDTKDEAFLEANRQDDEFSDNGGYQTEYGVSYVGHHISFP